MSLPLLGGGFGGGGGAGTPGGGSTARSAMVMSPTGPVAINTSTTHRDAAVAGVMINSR